MVSLLNLVLVMVLKNLLKNQKNCLSPKNRLSQEKKHQKVVIHLYLAPKKLDQVS